MRRTAKSTRALDECWLARTPPYERRVLLVEDEPGIRKLVATVLEDDGFDVTIAADVQSAKCRLDDDAFSVALIDENLPDGSGHQVADHVRARRLSTKMIMMTAHADLHSVMEAMRQGVMEYVEKPFADVQELAACAERARKAHAQQWSNRQLIDELRAKNVELELLATRDPLTKLFNHAHLQQAIEHEIARCRRQDLKFSMMLLDLDHFKRINDTYGHLWGDRVLTALAEVLRGDKRAADLGFRLREEDVAARCGGDEFALILPSTTKRGAVSMAARLRDVVARTITIGGTQPLTLSIGIASYPEDGGQHATLFEAADIALYAAKHAGRDRAIAYSDSLSPLRERQATAEAKARRLQALEETIAQRLLRLIFQPIVRANDASIFAYEALCRPSHPEFPSPYELIKTAEGAGRLGVLGRLLVELSFAALPRIGDDCAVFINLHPDQLLDTGFIDAMTSRTELARRVVFEITEVAEIRDAQRVRQTIRRLRDAGFRVALDDLGSGYSGLTSLARLEPDFIKLDMQLVHGIEDPRTARLVRCIMDFSEAEGIEVIAEGVEHPAQRAALEQLQCPLMQGYLFGHGVCLDAPGESSQDVELVAAG